MINTRATNRMIETISAVEGSRGLNKVEGTCRETSYSTNESNYSEGKDGRSH